MQFECELEENEVWFSHLGHEDLMVPPPVHPLIATIAVRARHLPKLIWSLNYLRYYQTDDGRSLIYPFNWEIKRMLNVTSTDLIQ